MAAKREFYTTNQVAQTLGISPFTIRRYIHLRKLKAVKLEGSYRVRRGDLERFLKAREIETEDELNALDAREDREARPAPMKRRTQAPVSPEPEEDDTDLSETASTKRTTPVKKKPARARKSSAPDAEPGANEPPATRKAARKPSKKRIS